MAYATIVYTQCPECKSIFEITAADLAVAGGFVRCGQCAVSFDALNSLSDNTRSLQAPGTSRAKAALENVKSKSRAAAAKTFASADADAGASTDQAEIEVRADDVEQDSAESPTDSPAGSIEDDADRNELPETERDEDIDRDEIPEAQTEEDIDRDETAADASDEDTDRDTKPPAAGDDDADNEAAPATKTETADDIVARQDGESRTETAALSAKVDEDEILLDDAYEPPFAEDDEDFYEDDELAAADQDDDEIDDSVDEPHSDDTPVAAEVDGADSAGEEDADESSLFSLPLPELTPLEHPEHGVLPEKLEGGAAARDPSAQTHLQAGDEQKTQIAGDIRSVPAPMSTRANDAFDAEDAHDLRNYLSAPKNRVASAAWISGSVLLVLLLLGQLVHHYRGHLVIHPRLGPLVGSVYKAIGADLRPNWRVDEYKVVGQARLFLMPLEDAEDEDATAIRFVAIISNGSRLPQPAPMVRLTLRNRWGDPTGMRDFKPSEYVADRAMAGRLLEPGERLRVVLNLQDLGAEAVGFDFDMCLPDEAGTLRCGSENSG